MAFHRFGDLVATTVSQPVGNLATALAHCERLLGSRPDLAEMQAKEILKALPHQPEALRLLGVALRMKGDTPKALDVLRPLAAAHPRSAAVQFELGLALGDAGECGEAIAALGRAVQLEPKHAHAWRALGDQLVASGDDKGADAAYARHIEASVNDPQLLQAAAALRENKLAVAERLLRAFLKENPTDIAAIRMLAETGTRLGRYEDAENLLARCLELAPSFDAARQNYAIVLYRQSKPAEALAQVEILLAAYPRNPAYRALKAAALGQIGEYERAVATYESLLKEYPQNPKAWMSYGHTLKTLGRTKEAIAAYRKSIERLPSLGESYWSLANLKTFRFEPADVAAMSGQLAQADLDDEDRLHFHFALGKAFEDEQRFEQSFAHYEQANAIRLSRAPYDPEELTKHVQRSKATFTREFFARREGVGCDAPDPIFIVGLPRAGSTLVEQILSSHPDVEATMELPDIIAIARRLSGRKRRSGESAYPEVLSTLDDRMFRSLGEEFLARTRVQRKRGKPFFIDKMPNNFQHVGLIHLILPNAKIIDVRRHPLACCFSNFKQHFARGQNFTYSLTDIGRYYRDYVALMAHLDAVLPGRVHRLIYEQLIADPRSEIQALLDHCGLPFAEDCLRYYENTRPVRTASSEQVRRPIYADALEHWRNYEPLLAPLAEALGPVLQSYPYVPEFDA